MRFIKSQLAHLCNGDVISNKKNTVKELSMSNIGTFQKEHSGCYRDVRVSVKMNIVREMVLVICYLVY